MVAPDLTKTEVQIDRGVAEVEVDQLFKQNDLLIDQGPSQTVLLKDGLYEFDASDQPGPRLRRSSLGFAGAECEEVDYLKGAITRSRLRARQ